MKIIHVLGGFYPDPMAGTEIYVEALALHLQEWGVSNVIAAPSMENETYYHSSMPVRRFQLNSAIHDVQEIYGLGDSLALASFKSILIEEQPNVVHFHTKTRAASLAMLRLSQQLGAKAVVTYHTPTMSCPRGTLLRWGTEVCNGYLDINLCTQCTLMNHGLSKNASLLVRHIPVVIGGQIGALGLRGGVWTALRMRELIALYTETTGQFYEESDQVIVLCDWSKKVLIRNNITEGKIRLVAHGINVPVISQPNEYKTRAASDMLRLVYLGRIEPIKGIHVVIQAIRALPAAKVTLDIYAVRSYRKNPYQDLLERLAENDSRIRFLDPVKNDEIVHLLTQYHALVVPSLWLETGPLVILEAFAAGIPVIGSRLGGIEELVTDNIDGLLVAIEDPNAWQHVLNMIIGDESILYRLRAGVRPPKTMKTVTAEMLAIYNNLLEIENDR